MKPKFREISLGSRMLEEIVRMREEGKSYKEIGRIFNKDHSTIVYWVKKHRIFSETGTLYIRKTHTTKTVSSEQLQRILSKDKTGRCPLCEILLAEAPDHDCTKIRNL